MVNEVLLLRLMPLRSELLVHLSDSWDKQVVDNFGLLGCESHLLELFKHLRKVALRVELRQV